MFTGRGITYVDAGAYNGRVYAALRSMRVNVRDAHLFEANPKSVAGLEELAADDDRVTLHPVALGDHEGVAVFELRDTMSRVVDSPTGHRASVEVPMTTLDAALAADGVTHVDLLKVDVEGSELGVLAGAKGLLEASAIDVIYIEAGMSGDSPQQVHHRDIEAALEPYGYRLIGVFEQTHEWMDDLPTLRRANLGFVSTPFAQSHPYRLSRDLMEANAALADMTEQHTKVSKQRAKLQRALSASEKEAAQQQHAAEVASARARKSDVAATRQQSQVADLEAQRDTLLAWGEESNRRLSRVLGSRWWRLTRYPRAAVRRTRRVLGKAPYAPIAPPPRPKFAPKAASAVALVDVEQILADAKALRVSDLAKRIRTLELKSANEQTWLALQFALICFDSIATAYANVTAHAEGIVDRRGPLDDDLARALGMPAYEHLLTNAAKAYGRLGMPEAATALLSPAIASGRRTLRVVRAEVNYLRDPESAVTDLTAFLKSAPANHRLRGKAQFLLAHLKLDGSASDHDVEIDQPEVHIAFAVDAYRRSDAAAYRDHLNDHFAAHGLAPVLAEDANAIGGFAWTTPELAASPHTDLVTVIVTAFNAESTLRLSVDSLRSQTHTNVEILIVDDHSTDGTLELAQSIAATDARVRVMQTPLNSGTYAAKNLAIAQAQGTFVTFHDSDDWAHPQRLERHLDVMHENPSLAASRSNWLRITGEGEIEVRRWGMTATHPNPASVFIRRDAFDAAGVFDTVRFGADSEFWFRLRSVLPRKATTSIAIPLGIGLHHPASLTRAGAGAWSLDHYSAVRSAYQLSWTEHHAKSDRAGLALRDGQARAFWAPHVMLRDGVEDPVPATRASAYPLGDPLPPFVFAISVASQRSVSDWPRTVELLDRTLHSVVAQSDPRWTAIVCGHERPDLEILDDPRIIFITCPKAPPTKSTGFRADKNAKRRIIVGHARGLGGGYLYPLDADDLVHRDVVAHALVDNNRRGYVATSGYAEDFAEGRLAPVPGAWTLAFDRVCGSAIVLYFERDDLPRWPSQTEPTYFDLFSHHAYWAGTAEEYRGPLDPMPFPGGVYVLNTGQNLSFGLQRANHRTTNILDAIDRHAVTGRFEILRDEFGQG